VTAQENTEGELMAEKALLDDARGTTWLIRVVLLAAVLAAAVLIWMRLRNRMTQARKVYLEHCSELAALQEKVVLGQMTSAVLYHARILNARIRSEGTKLQQLMPRMETEFAGVRETEPVLKNAHDNLDRINKLVEMNDESLGSFFEGMPVYRHPVPLPA